MVVYIYDRSDWPKFRWNRERLDVRLAAVRYNQGRLIGRMKEIGFSFRNQATLHTLTLDVLKSSEIEGEILDKEQVRSSIARRLGMNIGAMTPVSRDIEGVVEMMLDATQSYGNPLTLERLFAWHASLFPTGYGDEKNQSRCLARRCQRSNAGCIGSHWSRICPFPSSTS